MNEIEAEAVAWNYISRYRKQIEEWAYENIENQAWKKHFIQLINRTKKDLSLETDIQNIKESGKLIRDLKEEKIEQKKERNAESA